MHHISTHKTKGKKDNNKYNLVCLCKDCHTLYHIGEILIEKWVMSIPKGKLLMWKHKDDDKWHFT